MRHPRVRTAPNGTRFGVAAATGSNSSPRTTSTVRMIACGFFSLDCDRPDTNVRDAWILQAIPKSAHGHHDHPPPATEERLRAQAAATGKNISTLVVEAVEARLSLAQLHLRDTLAPVHADLHNSGMTDAELDAILQDALDESRSERSPNSGTPA